MPRHERDPGGGGEAAQLRRDARQTLAECHGRWERFRRQAGTALDEHMARSFGFVTNVLDGDSEPKDWIKDGLALWLRCYGTGRDLCRATHDLICPPDQQG
jgi:hypothetical protein